MRGTQGAFIIASTIQIILGFSGLWRNVVRWASSCCSVSAGLTAVAGCIISVCGLTIPQNFHRFLSPLSAAPLIALAGFGLYELGFPGVSDSSLISLEFILGCCMILYIFSVTHLTG
jgi:nucleobase transporter 1/2